MHSPGTPKPDPTPDPASRAGDPPLEVTVSGVLGVTGIGVAAGSCTAVTLDPAAGGCITQPRQTLGTTLGVAALGTSIRLPIP